MKGPRGPSSRGTEPLRRNFRQVTRDWVLREKGKEISEGVQNYGGESGLISVYGRKEEL